MSQLALAALGRDRPGIVEAITKVLLDHGVNVEDSQMTILRGRFSMTLVLGVQAGLERDELGRDLDAVGGALGLDALALSELETVDGEPAKATHIVTVYGADHPGIVHAAASALSEAEANITDLTTRVGGELYVLMLETAVPAGGLDRLVGAIELVGSEQGVEVSVRELERDEL